MKVISTDKAAQAVGPYSQAIAVDGFVFASGQLALKAENGELVNDNIQDATRQSLENVKAILEEAGSSLDKVVKTTVFLDDISDFEKMNEVYAEYFDEHKPARSCFEVGKLPKNAIVEIEVIAKI